VRNLVRNGRESACEGGREGRVLVLLERGDAEVRIAVEDDGPGITREAQPKLFVPFGTTKESGTGLGLALVAKIAALHGGTASAGRSERLGGARFVLGLPVS
jgi:signal transduction histidine kinase